MLGFYYSIDKIIHIMLIVTVSVIHCWLCSSTNHNSARCHLHTAPLPTPSIYSVTQSCETGVDSDALCVKLPLVTRQLEEIWTLSVNHNQKLVVPSPTSEGTAWCLLYTGLSLRKIIIARTHTFIQKCNARCWCSNFVRYCIKTSKDIVDILLPAGSAMTLVFCVPNSDGVTPRGKGGGRLKYRTDMKIARFGQ